MIRRTDQEINAAECECPRSCAGRRLTCFADTRPSALNTLSQTFALRALREQSLWRLLAADKAPAVLACLQFLLLDSEKTLPGSVLTERLTREIDLLRAAGVELPQTPQQYIADWLAQAWLMRRLPPGAPEEVFELSADAVAALRFVQAQVRPRSTATESRLAAVTHQLVRLAEATDPNPQTRVQALLAERDRIDTEIARVQSGEMQALPAERAIEHVREIIALADELAGDFRRVRAEFERLNRQLRAQLLEGDGSRGEVLDALFCGIDVIRESDAGRTFEAFWRLLTDAEQSALLEDALDAVTHRPFARALEPRERRFLLRLTSSLAREGGDVHDVLQHFGRSLKAFVRSREFLEQRRISQLIKQALKAALDAKDELRANQPLPYQLTLTSSRIRSVSQLVLHDPAQRVLNTEMVEDEGSDIGLDEVAALLRASEIDMRTLKLNIRSLLAEASQVSIQQLLQRFPALQGLGSVIGYVALGVDHGEVGDGAVQVAWQGTDERMRTARVPSVWFLRERLHELAD